MTRIVSKFGIAAALTLGLLSTAAAQATKKPAPKKAAPTQTVPVQKEVAGEVVTVHDTVRVFVRDTFTVYRRDTLTLTGPTVTRWDTVQVVNVPGWLTPGNGLYFGLGAGSYYPSGGIGGGQIPGYAFQMNLGVDPKGSPLGVRFTAGLARPDEEQLYSAGRGRPEVVNLTGDLKLRLPIFSGARFPRFSLYGVGGVAMVMFKDLYITQTPSSTVSKTPVLYKGTHSWHDQVGWDAGGGASLDIGHKRQLFLELRAINFAPKGFENPHQVPVILGVNWY
jgi:opacity protein-like surface antigen